MTVRNVFGLKMPDLALVVMECWLIGCWGKGSMWGGCWINWDWVCWDVCRGTNEEDYDWEGCSWCWFETEESSVGNTAEGDVASDWYELLSWRVQSVEEKIDLSTEDWEEEEKENISE